MFNLYIIPSAILADAYVFGLARLPMDGQKP